MARPGRGLGAARESQRRRAGAGETPGPRVLSGERGVRHVVCAAVWSRAIRRCVGCVAILIGVCMWARGAPVFPIYRDFPGILIVLILKTSGMGKWYLWDFDCLIPHQPF